MADKLWKFHVDQRRLGEVESVFVATEEEVNAIIGKEIFFGDILGKYSAIEIEVEEYDFTQLDVSDEAIAEVTAILGRTWSGDNPLDYYEGEDE